MVCACNGRAFQITYFVRGSDGLDCTHFTSRAQCTNGEDKPRRSHQTTYFPFIVSIKIFDASGRITRGSGCSPARSFSRKSRPVIETCL